MPLTPAELGELRHETQTIADRLRALRELVVDVYGRDSRAGESFIRAVDNMKHLQHALAKRFDLPAAAPPAAGSGGIVRAIEATAPTYLQDPITDAVSGDDD